MRYEVQVARTLLEKFGAGLTPVSTWAAQAEDYVQDWASAYGLARSKDAQARFCKTAPGALSGRVYASAVDQQRLEAATAWIGWLFFIDDQLDEGAVGRDPTIVRERLRPFVTVMAEMPKTTVKDWEADAVKIDLQHTTRVPLLSALRDIWHRLLPNMPNDWRAVFVQHCCDYLSGCEWEAGNRSSGHVPLDSEFLPMRRDAGAIWPSLDLLEYVADAPLPGDLRSHPLLIEIRMACADAVCWTDDLLTVAKERAHGDVHNLVIVLEHATACGERKAMEWVAQRIEARVEDFERLRQKIIAMDVGGDAKSALDIHVEGLRQWIFGHLEWGLNTTRYGSGAAVSSAYLEDLLGTTP